MLTEFFQANSKCGAGRYPAAADGDVLLDRASGCDRRCRLGPVVQCAGSDKSNEASLVDVSARIFPCSCFGCCDTMFAVHG